MSSIFDILKNPGDKMEISITPTLRKVVKMTIGDAKMSATQYSNGRIVKTLSYMPKSKDVRNLLELFGK